MPHPLELALLQHPQELHLRAERNLADLVEEDGSPVGQLEAPLLAPDRAGERAALVAEQLALEQRLSEGRTVHPDEGFVAARRLLV